MNLVIKLYIARFLSFFIDDDNLWLISERGQEARDNAYFFFVWLKKKHPEINAKYIISKESKDIKKLDSWSDSLIYYDSLYHLISIWKAKYLISTHVCGYTTDLQFFSKLDSKFHIFNKKKKIFLQHGIIKDDLTALHYGNISVDMFVCGSKLEYDYIKFNYGYPEGILKFTGLCRFDNLLNVQSKRQILVMPTFRIYIDKDHFEESEYFQAYKNLLTNKNIIKLLEEYGYQLLFYPHFEFQSKVQLFKKLDLPSCVTIADMNFDVQQLLKDSEILITDFSSVFFDMMYMNKPVLFFQFDEEKYRSRHYKKGYLDYHDVGPVLRDVEGVYNALKTSLTQERLEKYQNYYNETFPQRDCLNCQRVYDAIIRI